MPGVLVVTPVVVIVVSGLGVGVLECRPGADLMAGVVMVVVVIVAHAPRDGTRPAISPNRSGISKACRSGAAGTTWSPRAGSGTLWGVLPRPDEIGTAMGAGFGNLLDESPAVEARLREEAGGIAHMSHRRWAS